MEYIEWSKYKKNLDSNSILCPGYILDDKSRFIMEPGFYNQLQALKPLHADKYDLVINEINRIVMKNHKVYFTVDYEKPFIDLEGYIYLEINDVLDRLHIFVEDKSRGSDYGD